MAINPLRVLYLRKKNLHFLVQINDGRKLIEYYFILKFIAQVILYSQF